LLLCQLLNVSVVDDPADVEDVVVVEITGLESDGLFDPSSAKTEEQH